MKDWRTNAETVRAEIENGRRHLASVFDSIGSLDTFSVAVIRWAGLERNPEPLVSWLRSGKPLSPEDAEELADGIEIRERKLTPKRGRPARQDLRGVAVAAQYIYQRWCRLNDEDGIKDYGHRATMLDEAIGMAIEIEGWDIDPEAVRQFLERPASRRNSR